MYKSRRSIIAFLSLALIGVIVAVAPHSGRGQALEGNGATQLNCDEGPCDAVARGRKAFNDRELKKLGGNGRSCADCHMPSEGFQLSPAAAKARFDALQEKLQHNKNADDPLFRPVDADDFRINGGNAIDFSNLVDNGLVRVTMPLPLNVRLIDPATGQPTDETSVDLWRAVMPVNNVAITGPDSVLPIWPPGAPRPPIMGQDPNGPNRQGGYQHDARFGTLQEQARGALFAHAQVSVEPPQRMLDDLAAFQSTLFSSPAVESLADAILSGSTPFPDPDPELNELEQQGKVVFNRCLRPMSWRNVASEWIDARDYVRAPPRALSQHLYGLSASHDRWFRTMSRPAGAERAHIPHHSREWHLPIRHHFGSGTPASHGPTCGPGRYGRHSIAGNKQNCAVFSQQLRGHTRRGYWTTIVPFFRRVARLNPPPNLPPILSSNGLVVDRGFITPDERAALLAYLRKL